MSIKIGDKLIMPEPNGTDSHKHGGAVVTVERILRGMSMVLVKDADGDFFDLEIDRAIAGKADLEAESGIPVCRKQAEIDRLRRVLHDIAGSRPDQYMDVKREPELVKWICETCRKASVGAWPPG